MKTSNNADTEEQQVHNSDQTQSSPELYMTSLKFGLIGNLKLKNKQTNKQPSAVSHS